MKLLVNKQLNNQTQVEPHNPFYQVKYSEEKTKSESLIPPIQDIVFIDRRVEDYQTLVNAVKAGIDVVVLDSKHDGVEQITGILTQRQFSTVHIVSHGSPGCLYLGNSKLNSSNISEYTQKLKTWFEITDINSPHLPVSQSLFLYGCKVALEDVGEEFLNNLHHLTKANIIASNTPTGHSNKGGNWELEVIIGNNDLDNSDLDLAFTTAIKTSYTGILANFVVNSNADDSSNGTLRKAIEDANTNGEADTITFDTSLNGQTITLTNGQLLIADDITIQGLGADQLTISGDNTSRVFKIDDNDAGNQINVTIEGLTITGGQTPTVDGDDDGGGIWNRENLILNNVIVRNNRADDDGGGIRNDGELTIINSAIADNISDGVSSQFSGGGGLINTNATGASTTVINSTFSGNQAKNGGGIRNDGTLNIINSTFSANNSTLASGGGGAIANSTGIINIESSTITNNTAVGVGAGVSTASTVTVTNSIIAANTDDKDISTIFSGSFTSGGNNIIGNGDGVTGFTNGSNEDIVGTSAAPINPLLSALQDNGGVTQTHALLSGSPAINKGSNTKLVQDTFDLDGDTDTTENIPFEQRGVGFERIVDTVVDIGAYEFSPLLISEIMYNSGSDEPDWEWIEVYNTGDTTVDLTGYILDDDDNNALTIANINSGSIAANQTAILYNADAITENDFIAAWGNGINLIGVNNWSQFNNTGDKIGLWSSFDSYSGDHKTQTNAIDTVEYGTGFPDGNKVSIYLSDLNTDNSIGTNWSISSNGNTTPAGRGYSSTITGNHVGGDIASPGGLIPVNITSTTADGTYKIGDTIDITVEFSEIVNVTGTPQLTLETGTIDRIVDYVNGSGTNILTFSYIVEADDESLDLDYLSNTALTLNNGSIQDGSGNDAILTLPNPGTTGSLGDNKDIIIDGILPTVTNITSTTINGTYKIGDTIDITVEFSEIVNVTDTPQLTLETGTTDRIIDYVSGSGTNILTFSYIVETDDESLDLDYISNTALTLNNGSIQDGSGNDATLTLP
ncbi:MAG: DUF4347 domain-containing protein, partial [Cyanobacteria bacterium P01_A01_bin.84]